MRSTSAFNPALHFHFHPCQVWGDANPRKYNDGASPRGGGSTFPRWTESRKLYQTATSLAMSLLWHKWKIRPCSFCHQREKTDEHFHNPRSTATGKQTRWSQKSFSATLGSRWPASSSPPSFSLQTSSDLSSCYFALQSHWYMHNMQLSYLKLSSSKGGSVRLYAFLGAHHWCRQRRQRHHCHWPLCRLLRSVIVMTTLILKSSW